MSSPGGFTHIMRPSLDTATTHPDIYCRRKGGKRPEEVPIKQFFLDFEAAILVQ